MPIKKKEETTVHTVTKKSLETQNCNGQFKKDQKEGENKAKKKEKKQPLRFEKTINKKKGRKRAYLYINIYLIFVFL